MKSFLLLPLLLLSSSSSFAQFAGPEAILGFISRRDAVYVQVHSGGCTSKEDFKVKAEMVGENRRIYLLRERPDECLALFPQGQILKFSYDELGLRTGDHFMIANPIQDSVAW